MTKELARLARSNPVVPDDTRGAGPAAQAQLAAILVGENKVPTAFQRFRRRRAALLALAVAPLIAAGALAATNPAGFWQSSSPAMGKFAVDLGRHVPTPTVQIITCPRTSTVRFRCAAARAGGRYPTLYRRVASIRAPRQFDRKSILQDLTKAVASKRISARLARRIRAELETVPDSFVSHFNVVQRFKSFTLAYSPPSARRSELIHAAPGYPEAQVRSSGGTFEMPLLLACLPGRTAAVECTALNADRRAPIGAGIYGMTVGVGWSPVPASASGPEPPSLKGVVRLVFGQNLTPATWALVRDLLIVTR